MAITASTSWLDTAHDSQWNDRPYFAETVELLRCVRDHDFDSLAALCDDDFGIVDLDQSGSSVMVRTRDEWEAWFRRLFTELDAMAAAKRAWSGVAIMTASISLPFLSTQPKSMITASARRSISASPIGVERNPAPVPIWCS